MKSSWNLSSSISKIIGISASDYAYQHITYNQESFDDFCITYYLTDKAKSKALLSLHKKTYIDENYSVKLSLTSARNIKATVKMLNTSNISVSELKSSIGTIFEPINLPEYSTFKVQRDSNWNIGLRFQIEYDTDTDLHIFTKQLNKLFGNTVNVSQLQHWYDSTGIEGFIYPNYNSTIKDTKPLQYGVKDIAQATLSKVLLTLDDDTKFQILHLLSNYANNSKKSILDIHDDLGINRTELKNLLNIEKMMVTYELLSTIAALNNKQLSVKII